MPTTITTRSEHLPSRALLSIGAALLAALAAACGGTAADELVSVEQPAPPGTEPQQHPDTQHSSTGSEGAIIDLNVASAACGVTPSGVRKATSQHEFDNMIVGAWQLCSDSSVFGTADAGLLIDADGRWSKLALVDGQLTALHGWSNEGSWETIDTSRMNGPGVYQLNLSIDGSGTVITIPQIAAEPELMRLDNNGVFRGDYARLE